MADSKLLVPELNDAETMGAETSRFQELLLQVQTEWTPGSQGIRGIFFFFFGGVWFVNVCALRKGMTVPSMHWEGNRASGSCSTLWMKWE